MWGVISPVRNGYAPGLMVFLIGSYTYIILHRSYCVKRCGYQQSSCQSLTLRRTFQAR